MERETNTTQSGARKRMSTGERCDLIIDLINDVLGETPDAAASTTQYAGPKEIFKRAS